MKNNQNKNITHSFRFQIVSYSLVSMALTAVTLAVLLLMLVGVIAMVRNEDVNRAGYPLDAADNSYNNIYHAINSEIQNNIPTVSIAAASDTGGTGVNKNPDSNSSEHYDIPEPTVTQKPEKFLKEEELTEEAKVLLSDKKQLVIFGMRIHKSVFTVMVCLFIFLALFFFILYFLLLMRKFSSYLEEITGGIKRLATGEFRTRIEVRQSNELTEIASSFNKMAGDLERIVREERQNEKVKNELITSVAHDLRTPLTSVIGYLELVAEKNLEPETREHYVSVAYRKARRLQKLIDDLFSYTKYGAGELQMNTSSIDSVKIMEQLMEEFYPNIQENQLEIEMVKKTEYAMVEGDGMLLARAFANLLGNAIKYGRDGKNLKIIMETVDMQVKIHIINFGEVIPPEALPFIFERFYRVDASRTEKQGGTGLGLAIAKNIIERHKGTITVKSDLEGTEFLVSLPLALDLSEEAAHGPETAVETEKN